MSNKSDVLRRTSRFRWTHKQRVCLVAWSSLVPSLSGRQIFIAYSTIFHTVSDKNLTRGKAGYEAKPGLRRRLIKEPGNEQGPIICLRGLEVNKLSLLDVITIVT